MINAGINWECHKDRGAKLSDSVEQLLSCFESNWQQFFISIYIFILHLSFRFHLNSVSAAGMSALVSLFPVYVLLSFPT